MDSVQFGLFRLFVFQYGFFRIVETSPVFLQFAFDIDGSYFKMDFLI